MHYPSPSPAKAGPGAGKASGHLSTTPPRTMKNRRSAHATTSPSSWEDRPTSVVEEGSRRSSSPRTPPSPPTRSSSLGAVDVTRASHVQAIHDFDPSIMPSSSQLTHNMYLSFRAAEVIRVHGRDASGWWDGEIAGEEPLRRGWFPSNYVREVDWTDVAHLYSGKKSPRPSFDNARDKKHTSAISYASHASHGSHLSQHSSQHSSASHRRSDNPFAAAAPLAPGLQALYQPIVQSLTLLQTSIHQSNVAHIQPSTAAVISAIRIALVRMDCMGKDSQVFSAHPTISKERRYVLAELSKLVACAKVSSDSETDIAASLEATGKAARSVFGWVRKFMIHANEVGVKVLPLDQVELTDSPNLSNMNGDGRIRARAPSASGIPRSTQEAFRLKSASINDLRGAARRQAGALPVPRPASRASTAVSPALSGSGRSSPISFAAKTRVSSARGHARASSIDQSLDSPDLDGASSDMSHTMVPRRRADSVAEQELVMTEFASRVAVHEAIAAAEDALLSIIASFIGHIHSHHIDSHPSSHAYLIELTRETVDRVRDLLSIVETVGRQASLLGVHLGDVESLRGSRMDLYHATTRLVEGAEAVANAPFSEGGSDAYDAEKAGLLQVTTTTLRAGTECARVVRASVPEHPGGDSDFESPIPAANGRLSRYSGVGLGIRGPMTTLSRRATSLGQLHRRYHQDGVHAGSPPIGKPVDNDSEEVVEDASDESTVAPSRSHRPTSQPIVLEDVRATPDALRPPRSRATSFNSPSKRRSHKSPSLSADYAADKDIDAISRTSSHTPQPEPSENEEENTVSLSSPQPTPRPGEEGGDVRFWVVAHDYDPREVAFNSDGVLVGGTLRVLVEKMTPHDGMPDSNFSTAFWYTFRLFCNPEELVTTLISRYELKPPPVVAGMDKTQLDTWVERKLMPVRLRVYNFIKSWLDQHWRADTDDVVLDKLEAFALDIVTPTLPAHMGPRLAEQVRKRQAPQSAVSENSTTGASNKPTSFERMRHSTLSGMLHTPVAPSQVPTPVIAKALHTQLMRNPTPANISILDFDTLELARQLTIMESKLFAAVAPEDLLMTGKKAVPELKALSTLSNHITGWVADGILNEQDAKHRAALLKFYIKLADKCLSLNNFSSLFAVLAGLNSSTILRLKKTWDVLNVKYRLLMERLRGVIEHTKNHAAYRARLREVSGPCLPFLGLILSDITFTQDGNPNTRPSTLSDDLQLINQDKFTKLGRIAADFRRYQLPFDLKELEPVQGYLQRVLAERGSGSLDALYRKSLLLEPRQGSERLSSAVEKPGWLGVRLQV